MNKKTQHGFKHHHKKPYRLHHITLAGVSIFILLVSLTYLLIFYALQPSPPPVNSDASTTTFQDNEIISVRSSLGFGLDVNRADFSFEATFEDADDTRKISDPDELTDAQQPISELKLTPESGTVSPDARASTLTIRHEDTDTASTATPLFDNDSYEHIKTEEETIGDEQFEKNVYRYTPRSEQNTRPIYSITWDYANDKGRYTILLQGLLDDADVPSAYATVLDSFRLGETLALQFFSNSSSHWVSRSESTRQYLSDLLSPAVVKLYHVVCGTVEFELENIPEQQCRAVTGSGFFISSEGHIATNGHVVVYEPEDALVDTLLNNPLSLSTFLAEVVGLSPEDITALERQPEELAWVISKIYELPDEEIAFTDKSEAILAAIGSTPLLPESEEELEGLFTFRDTEDIKRADIIDYSYSGKDQLNITSGNEEGFSKSDVALLRVRTENTPLIQLASPADASPGKSITILGFPSDAENELVDHNELVTSVTNGTISSIRTAAGGSGTLLQTDTDASQGNSGGPAVTTDGKAVGLLTYRYKDQTTQNAAKSYLRDVGDVRGLIEKQGLSLNLNSQTQQAWSKGLQYYAASRFHDALEQFEIVANKFPPHRLVETYIDASETNINNGLDKSPPVLQYAGIIGGTGMLAASTRLISKHRIHHRAYQQQQENSGPPQGEEATEG